MVTNNRRTAILRHIARYGVTLRPVLERLFNRDGTGSLDNDLKILRQEDLIAVVANAVAEPLDSRTKYSYYQLTRKACGEIGAPESRARRPGGPSLDRSVAILWFCCMTKGPAHRLSTDEVAALFSLQHRPSDHERVKEYVSGFHCLSRGKEFFQVHNLYATRANNRDTLGELKKRVEDARRIAAVSDAIRSREYIFTLLVETPQKRDELRQEIAKQLGNDGFVFNVCCSPRSWRFQGPNR